MSVLVCENISKYTKKKELVHNFSYNFLDNTVYCLIGKTDAGQTDILNLISSKTQPTEGRVYLDGKLLSNNTKLNNRICFIPNTAEFPKNITILKIFKILSGFYPNWDTFYAYELLTHFEIKHNIKFGNLTKSQKSVLIGVLNIASLANITILDEPLIDADIKDRYDFFNFLYLHKEKKPRTFIINTNYIDDIDFLVDKLLLIDNGKLIQHFMINELKQGFRYLTGKTEVLKSLITGVKVIGVEERGKMLTVCIRQKLKKDEIRKYQKYLIKISDVPIQKIIVYLINLRELKGIN